MYKIGDKVQWFHGNLTRIYTIISIEGDNCVIQWRDRKAIASLKDLRFRPKSAKSETHTPLGLADALFGGTSWRE